MRTYLSIQAARNHLSFSQVPMYLVVRYIVQTKKKEKKKSKTFYKDSTFPLLQKMSILITVLSFLSSVFVMPPTKLIILDYICDRHGGHCPHTLFARSHPGNYLQMLNVILFFFLPSPRTNLSQ
jgi:hypothetical protein